MVAGCEEVVVAYVGGFLARGEAGHGVVGKVEFVQEALRFREKLGDLFGRERVGDEEVAIVRPVLSLLVCEASEWRRGDSGGSHGVQFDGVWWL